MDKPISVGDLVAIIKWGPCGCGLGKHARVTGFGRVMNSGCAECNTRQAPGSVDVPAVQIEPDWDVPLSWVKRIPPLDELDDVKRDEEITA